MINKYLLTNLLLLSILITACSSCKVNPLVDSQDYDIGETTNTTLWKLPRDSFHFLSPRIEAYNNNGLGKATPDIDFRARLRAAIVRVQKTTFPEVRNYDLPVMLRSYKTLRKYLDYQTKYKLLNPNRNVQVSNKFVVKDKKYGAFFSVIWGCCGDDADLDISLIVIDNENRTIKKINRTLDEGFAELVEGVLEGHLEDLLDEVIEGN